MDNPRTVVTKTTEALWEGERRNGNCQRARESFPSFATDTVLLRAEPSVINDVAIDLGADLTEIEHGSISCTHKCFR